MSAIKIRSLAVQPIFDSRGEVTIEVELATDRGPFFGQVPTGKSRGSREVAVLAPTDAKHAMVRIVEDPILGKSFQTVSELDHFLIRLDGTERKTRVGGNLMLAISIAGARALAAERGESVWELLNEQCFEARDFERRPRIFVNFIEGGKHAKNNLALQEYLVIADPGQTYAATTEKLTAFHQMLGERLAARLGRGKEDVSLGDEGGYAVDFKNNLEPILVLETLIREVKFENRWALGLDAAASSFYRNGSYEFEKAKLSAHELAKTYVDYFKMSSLLESIEDPFAEDDEAGFKELSRKLGKKVLVVGDDLTTTNPEAIDRAVKEKLVNAVIIKPNQIGTVTESCDAIRAARKRGAAVIISHRSGETNDQFIIHLARACGADGVKIGAPVRDRIGKYDELIRVWGG